MTCASSQVFIEVRSSMSWAGNALLISSNIGPEKVFSAIVVRIVETLNSRAALATRAALLRRVTASIDLVANAICDWKSSMISVWSRGLNNWRPGIGLAVGMENLLLGMKRNSAV